MLLPIVDDTCALSYNIGYWIHRMDACRNNFQVHSVNATGTRDQILLLLSPDQKLLFWRGFRRAVLTGRKNISEIRCLISNLTRTNFVHGNLTLLVVTEPLHWPPVSSHWGQYMVKQHRPIFPTKYDRWPNNYSCPTFPYFQQCSSPFDIIIIITSLI